MLSCVVWKTRLLIYLSNSLLKSFICVMASRIEPTSKTKYYVPPAALVQISMKRAMVTAEMSFIFKLQIALKECNETSYWIQLLQASDTITKQQTEELLNLCKRIRIMLIKSLNTAKGNKQWWSAAAPHEALANARMKLGFAEWSALYETMKTRLFAL